MAFEFLTQKDIDLSQIGIGDSLMFEIDKEKGYLRISVFDHDHFQDQIVIDLEYEFGN